MKATVFDEARSSIPLRRRVDKKDEIVELDTGLQILITHVLTLGSYEIEFRLTKIPRETTAKD